MKLQLLALRQFHFTLLRASGREILFAKGIRGEQAVGPHMPARRVAEAIGHVEDDDARRLAVDCAVVVDPLGGAPPRGFVLLTVAVANHSSFFGIDVDLTGDAQSERAFFGVTKDKFALAGSDDDGEVDPAAVLVDAELDRSLILADFFAVVEPVVHGNDFGDAVGGLAFPKLAMLDLIVILLVRLHPEVETVDRSVIEPERAVVGMIVLLARQLLAERVLPRHRLAAGANDRPDHGLVAAI
jgi:hypothetical protein